MQKGWNARGRLTPLYKKHGGREGLAAKTGVPAGTLSRINTGGGNMGEDVAKRIAGPLKISVLELGAPAEMVDGKGRPVLDRLEAVEGRAARLEQEARDFGAAVFSRLAAIEEALEIEAPALVPPGSAGDPP